MTVNPFIVTLHSAMQNFKACNNPQETCSKLKHIKTVRLRQPFTLSYHMKDTRDLFPDEINETGNATNFDGLQCQQISINWMTAFQIFLKS